MGNISDLVGLNNLQKSIGDFLILDYWVIHLAGYTYAFVVKISDPGNGETVFHVEHRANNMAGLETPLFHPVLNSILRWGKTNQYLRTIDR